MCHILVVDDDPSIRTLVNQILEGEGYRVTTVAGARDAHEVIKTEPIDAALLDVRGQDAPALATTLRSHTAGLPIFLFTALNRHEADETLATMPEDVGLILKPFDPDELITQLAVALDGARGGGPGSN